MNRSVAALILVPLFLLALADRGQAQEGFKQTYGSSQYAHYIQLYDAAGTLIDPSKPDARPYSPYQTCKKCHDYEAISHGWHFNAAGKMARDATGKGAKIDSGRRGEPWIYTDLRTGTQAPISLRDWAGTYKPRDFGLTRLRYLIEFGRHMPGGGLGDRDAGTGDAKAAGETKAVDAAAGDAKAGESKPKAAERVADNAADDAKLKLAGALEIDCLFCHSADRSYSHERWIKNVHEQNFAWASTAASGLGVVKGSIKSLPEDFDPAKAAADATAASPLPVTKYDKSRFDAEGFVFVDVLRKPLNNACYACHSTKPVGPDAEAKWVHDGDVHVRAGIACADCHRNDLGHHTVRGFVGEKHATGEDVRTLSCRGCHLDQNEGAAHADAGGRLGAPKPLHKGLPPVHLEKMSCTACHSGVLPKDAAQRVQTSMAHSFGLPLQTRNDDEMPAIVQPVFLKDEQGVLTPHRAVWPAFWGTMEGDTIAPLPPNEVFLVLRRVLRLRADFRKEAAAVTLTPDERKAALGDAAAKADADLSVGEKEKLVAAIKPKASAKFRENVAKALEALVKPNVKGVPVYVANGQVYQFDKDAKDKLKVFAHKAAEPYAWPLAHDVRPARQSLGITGCTECHSKDAKISYSTVTALGPATDDAAPSKAMYELGGYDQQLLAQWEQSFQGRPIFKWVGFTCIGAVVLILVLYFFVGLSGILKLLRRCKC